MPRGPHDPAPGPSMTDARDARIARRRLAWFLIPGLAGGVLGCEEEPEITWEDPNPEEIPPAEPPVGAGTPPAASLKLLRTFEYRNTMAALLGDAVSVDAELRPDLVRANFTSVSASVDCYEEVGIEAFETIALDVAAQAFATSPTPLDQAGCAPADAGDDCVADFIADFGLRAWRRPLDGGERAKYVGLVDSLSTLYAGDVVKGVELTVAALLQSPNFLYRVELGWPVEGDPDTRKYSGYEMASRLAYSLWEGPPDRALLDAAGAGELDSAESVMQRASEMVADPRAEAALGRFWREHLNVDRLTLENYPRSVASEELYAAMRAEGEALVAQAIASGTDARTFLTSTEAELTPELAELYGASSPDGGPVTLPAERMGYLTSGVFLATQSHPTKTSPTRRGKFVLERILCQDIPPPPPDVDLELPEAPEGGATQRELLEAHRNNPVCAACHDSLDPLGFAFEQFDAMGQFREMDNGLPADPSGEWSGTAFQDAVGLIDILKDDPDVSRCLAIQTFRGFTGHLETAGQDPYIDEMVTSLEASGHDFRTLVAVLLGSEAFRYSHDFVGAEEN